MKQDILDLINQSNKIAILSGAGVSTTSGIRDFRGKNGLYTEQFFGLNPEQILNVSFFNRYRDLFYRYYVKYMAVSDDVQPNVIHHYTKQLSDDNKLTGVVTQNIDGLYQKSALPSEKLVEIHGNGSRWLCTKCKHPTLFSEARFNKRTGNYLSACHDFIIKPDIILYDECYTPENVKRMKEIYAQSDLLLVMGTKLEIVPQLQSVLSFKGKIALINKEFIPLRSRQWDAQYVGNIEDVFHE